jgi:hypothetical protein
VASRHHGHKTAPTLRWVSFCFGNYLYTEDVESFDLLHFGW